MLGVGPFVCTLLYAAGLYQALSCGVRGIQGAPRPARGSRQVWVQMALMQGGQGCRGLLRAGGTHTPHAPRCCLASETAPAPQRTPPQPGQQPAPPAGRETHPQMGRAGPAQARVPLASLAFTHLCFLSQNVNMLFGDTVHGALVRECWHVPGGVCSCVCPLSVHSCPSHPLCLSSLSLPVSLRVCHALLVCHTPTPCLGLSRAPSRREPGPD